ncbi:striatin-4-like, partial [Anomalospiza imberbis]|uniref:striatin-4-like n=1 Tax=Anomalospiza imberbis TaxID=187417 RepID=UPI00358F2AB4
MPAVTTRWRSPPPRLPRQRRLPLTPPLPLGPAPSPCPRPFPLAPPPFRLPLWQEAAAARGSLCGSRHGGRAGSAGPGPTSAPRPRSGPRSGPRARGTNRPEPAGHPALHPARVARFEAEKGRWEAERAELQAQVAFLQGERQGQESLKLDLVRRIRMLEFALKQERSKYQRLRLGTEEPRPEEPGERRRGRSRPSGLVGSFWGNW